MQAWATYVFRFLAAVCFSASASYATNFTSTVPGTSITLPTDYPEAGGVAFVLIGANGNLYYQFSNPAGAFRGFNSNGQPARFRGNPFTINDPLVLDCGFSSCSDYFGGGLQQVFIRFSAYDGDTQPGGFDEDDISLIINGFNVGSWSGLTTEITDTSGTQSFGFTTGFGNNTFNTGWFSSTNPALLQNILDTNQTTTQVLDDDPNDNYWDFRRGQNLSNTAIVTVAPGYTLEKTADKTDFSAVNETINYTFVVTNIGSVPIRNLSVFDDVIGSVSCDKTEIFDTNAGGTPDFATCTASYQTTQEDLDRGFVTNTATAQGTPDFGVLGALSDSATVDGPVFNPVLFVDKTSSLTAFGDAGTAVPYEILIRNDGNVTLSNLTVDDPLLPGLSCTPPDLAPGDEFTCTGSYTVQQTDVDDFAADAANTLDNTVTVEATDPGGAPVQQSDLQSLPGPSAAPGIDVTKTAQTADYEAVDDVLTYQIRIENTGNVSYPVPTVDDPLTSGATCPAGSIAPGAFVVCSASYAVDQIDINTGQVDNTASATVTVGGVTVSDSDTATVSATRRTGLTLDKRLAAASPTTFAAENVALSYEYVLTNTGNVTLLSPTVSDDRVPVTCSETEILPGTSITCVSDPYLTTQTNLNDGEVTNTATASATEAGPVPNTVTSASDSVTVPATQQPELTLVKTAPVVAAVDFVEDAFVTYSFEVTNTGNIDLTQDTIGASDIQINDDKIGTFSCQPTPLNIGDSITCTAQYQLTQTDIQAGTVVNVATAFAGAVVSDQVSAQIAPDFTPAIGLTKSALTASVSGTTDTIQYEFVVENTGDTNLTLPGNAITISDAALTSPADCSAQPDPFAPGATFSCFGERVGVTQGELDAGQVDNSATAAFDFTNNGTTTTITSNQGNASVPVDATPAMVFTKSGPAEFVALNEALTYTFEVENTGNVSLSQVTVTDPLIPGLSCTLSDIAPGATDSCTGTYTVTQADVDAEVIDNTATATAIPAQGAQFSETDSASAPIEPATPAKTATLTKQADKTAFTTLGEQITYTMRVENTGTQTLSALQVTDILDPGFNCTIATLAPGDVDTTCVFTHTVTQDDIDAGEVFNEATLSSAEIAPQTDDETVSGPARVASYDFEKRVNGGYTAENDVLTYTFRVENTGNVTLTDLQISDPFFGTPFACTIASLAPGTVDNTTCSATYTVRQPDVDAGSLSNTATITVDAPAGVGDPADQDSTAVSNGPVENASLAVDKQSTDGTFTSASDSEVFTFTVTNTGNVTLTKLSLNDGDLGFTCAIADLGPGESTTQCADTTLLSATAAFDQDDVDNGSYSNRVDVTGESAGLGTPVSAFDEETVTGPAQVPALTLTKTSTFAGTLESVGQILTYDFEVENTGNITITSNISVSDDLIDDVNCPVTPAAGVVPGATLTCTGEYEVTQDDLDAGQVLNRATASVTQPIIPQNPGDDPFVTVTSNQDTATVTVDQQPALRLAKRVKASSASSYSAPNDVVTFEYVVTNIGNVTTTDPITVVDNQIAGTLVCTTATVAPGASVTCEQDWVAEQPDVDAGSVTNLATASTEYNAVTVNSNVDSVTINAVQTPELSIEKTFVSTDRPGFFNVGDNLTYEIVVENTGNVTIDAPITLTDNLTTPVCPAVPGGELLPGDTLTCSSSHTVTANDIALGSAANVVFATGTFDGAPVQSPSDDAIYPVDANPALSLTKTAQSTNVPFTAVGQIITYDYVVTNTGNVGLAGEISIVDDVIGTFTCKESSAPPLGTTQSVSCVETYEITQDDLDRGFVTNNATAQTVFPPDSSPMTQVVSPNASATVLADQDEELTVTKEQISGITTASVGDTLTYRITAENTGNQTLSGASISDPLLPTLTCTVGGVAAPANVVLEPGESLVCEGDYAVTQDDIDAQTLVNVATATSTDPQGETVGGSDTISQALDAPVVAMTVSKAIQPEPAAGAAFTDPGQELTFVISVENTGNITLSEAVVTDERLVTPASCTVGPIEPGETDDSCVFTYVVTQADIDQDNGTAGSEFGGFTNTAEVTATPNNQDLDPITETGSVFVRGPPQEPQINLVKESTTTEITTFNQRIEYIFTIANTGNVTLFEEPQITDNKIGTFTCSGIPGAGLAPSEFYQCTADYFVTQADLDAGFVTNTATATSSELDSPVSTELTIDGTRTPGLTLTKTPSVLTGVAAGETIEYTYVATNTGNVTLSNVTLVDQHTTAAGTAPLAITSESLTSDVNEIGGSVDSSGPGIWTTLGPGDEVTFVASYVVTQADVDAEISIDNTATLTAASPDGATLVVSDTRTVALEAGSPALEVTKTADDSGVTTPAQVGQVVSYEIEVANTGNQTLDNVVLTDSFVDGNNEDLPITLTLDRGDGGVAGDLDVGETWVYVASFTLTQDAIDSGALENTVRVAAEDPQGAPIVDEIAAPVVVDLPQDNSFEVVKSVDASDVTDPAQPDQEVVYRIELANTGNVTLTDVLLVDSFVDGANEPLSITPVLTSGDAGTVGALDVGETWIYEVTYAIQQSDIDSGGLSNTVTVTATDPNGVEQSETIPAPVVVDLGREPGIEGEKIVLTSAVAVDETVTFQITATNTGNVTLTDVAVASDRLTRLDGTVITLSTPPVFTGSDQGSGLGTLLPGETATYTATYTLTQEDIDAGGIRNSATVTGTPPVGAPETDVTDNGDDTDGNTTDDAAELLIEAEPSIALTKQPSDAAPVSFDTVGTEIPYEFVVENTGNVTLFDEVVIADPLITDAGGEIVCPDLPAEGLAPDATLTCTATYVVTQEDIDAGSVDNTATATLGAQSSDPSETTTPAVQQPELTMLKEAPVIEPENFVTGLEITYTFTTTNTGNTTIFDPISVVDTLIPDEQIECPAFPDAGLLPDETYVCTGTYVVTATDVDLGSITNLASATDGTTNSTLSSVTVPNEGVPALTIEKEAVTGGFEAVDDPLEYTFTVTNSGTRAFAQPVVVTDTLIGDITCFAPTEDDPDFVAGETATCTGSYAVTQDDLDEGSVLNEAYAFTTFGADDTTVLSPADSVVVDANLTPALSIEKTAATLPVTGVDQVLTYTVTVTNSGNQTITNVSANDPLLDGFVCEAAALAPAEVLTCTGSYTVTQDDVDAGSLSNTADASGVSPQGDPIEDVTTLVVGMPAAEPSVVLTKTATPEQFGAVGSTLTYLLAVENTGNVTLSDLVVTDVLDPGFSCGIARLAPGEINRTCTLDIEVTQEMVDAGGLDNVASVSGTAPNDTEVSDEDALFTEGPEKAPALEATKVVLPAPGTVDAVVPFVLTVRNTGNVTLDDVQITDQMVDGNDDEITLDAPFALDPASDAGSDGVLSVGEAWTYRAQVTLTQDIVNSGGLSNQVSATARDPDEGLVTDLSDDGDDADGNTENDRTDFEILAEPGLSVVKTVQTPGSAVGDEVVFAITATNIGNVTLSDVTATDELSRLSGEVLDVVVTPVSVPDPLDSGAEATWEARYTLTQDDIDAGGVSNTASVTGTTPEDETVTDVSSDGDPADGNIEDDPTVLLLDAVPSMEVIKTPVEIGMAADETVTYEITVENSGNVTLSGLTLADSLTDLDGQTPRTPALDFVSSNGTPPSPEGTLAPGETATYRSTVTLLQSDIEAGGLINSVSANAQTLLGQLVQDVSDDDGTGANDPTVTEIAAAPALVVNKTAGEVTLLFPTVEQVTFTITVENTGNVIQSGIDLQDNLAAFASPAVLLSEDYPVTVTAEGFTDGAASGSYDGQNDLSLLSGNPTLAPGEIGTVTVTLVYSTAAAGVGGQNTASATSDQLATPVSGSATVALTDSDGDGVPDTVETGADRDGDGIPDNEDYDPTGYFYCEDTGTILSGGQISVSGNGFTQTGVGTSGSIVVVQDGSSGFYQFFVTAPGSYTLNLTYPPAGVASTARTSLGSLDVTTLPNPGNLGSSEFGGTGALADFSAGANPFYTTFVFEAGDPIVLNNNIPLTQCAGAPAIEATKTADRNTAVFGETINYTLTFRNNTSATVNGAQIVDRLPGGLVYTPGTARIDGVATEPTITGGSLLWTVNLAPAQTITATFSARVRRTGEFGTLTNRTWLQDSTGARVSNVARADVRIDPEHVFDCSDVIGKVFDDRNGNGYQDGPPSGRANDEAIEPGIPGVRLATPDGLLITTDEFGRFSVPCAALPKNIGSNFQLKLDTRTLPTGYRVTTENPRNIRLTAGKIAKMNFGAMLGQVVRIDLNTSAFAAGQISPGAELDRAIDGLLGQIASTPSVLRLTYALQAEEPAETGRARLKRLEELIEKRWRGTGTYKLIIERTVTRVKR